MTVFSLGYILMCYFVVVISLVELLGKCDCIGFVWGGGYVEVTVVVICFELVCWEWVASCGRGSVV